MAASTLVMLPPATGAVQRWAARLRESFPDLAVVVCEDVAAAHRALGTADAAYGTLPSGWDAPRLRWLQAPMAAPPVGYFSPELIAHPVTVTNMRGIYNDHIATHVMALVLSFVRGLPRHARNQRDHRYRPERVPVVHLAEARVLLVGAGGVGRQVARYLEPFGPDVVAVDARERDPSPGLRLVRPAEALDEELPSADIVIVSVPHTPETEGLFDRARFALMKPSAHFVNIGRGMTVRLDDLVAALEAGELAGAGLDVLEQEPLPPDHPLWDLPGVVITPHVAIDGPYLDDRRYEVIAENCRRFLADEPLFQVVDKRRWF
jgi:phosphoglycerate dehydrogenase-like enzyme